MFIDDLPENLKPAKAMGMVTVLISQRGGRDYEYVDYKLRRIEDLAQVFHIAVP